MRYTSLPKSTVSKAVEGVHKFTKIWLQYIILCTIIYFMYYITIKAVLDLSVGLGVQPAQFSFQPPRSFSKITLGGQAEPPPEERSIAQCILLSACIKRFPTRLSFRMNRSGFCLVDYLLIYFSRSHTCWCSIFVHLCHIHRYVFASNCGSREIESLNAAECYIGWYKINEISSWNYVWATF